MNEVSGKIKMDVLGAVPQTAAIDDCTVDLAEGLRLTAKIQTMDAWDTTALQVSHGAGKQSGERG